MADPKRSGVTAIHSLDRFVFSVPDIGVAKQYFTDFGLDVRQVGSRLDLYTFGHPHRWGSIYESGKPKKLEYLALGVYAEDYEPLRRHLEKTGVKSVDPHPLVDEQGFWLRDPDGITLQIVVAEKSSPNRKGDTYGPMNMKNPAGIDIGINRRAMQPVKPVRLTHALLFCSDVPRSLKFYREAMGMNLSDQSGDGIAFMHGVHSSDHHLLAFAKSNGPGLHHTSWVVRGVDEVGLGMEQMLNKGYPYGWGMGRHVLGSNYFYYQRDPWGSFTEYSYDIDFVGLDGWPAQDHPPEDSFYLWGPAVPEDFITNHETQAHKG
ncbi:MAG: VOC family protein [Ferrovibrio sp.]|uniref:VOC family protein n=1 Tax=Ferrovibrio sp. TaxID=1917215 RepID=UPI00262DF7AE|nr:VOC family protein [Ferrovibrio sp.]MCW0235039.1 VOC family protein [Ferrovibrio sp.]